MGLNAVTTILSQSRVLLTGGSGFLGSHLARRLISEHADVHVLVRPSSSLERIDDIAGRLTLHHGELGRIADVRACVRAARPEIIFNLAAMPEREREARLIGPSIDINVAGALSLIRAVLEERLPLRSFVQAGTAEEYGSGPAPFVESQREQPVSPYSAGKAATTHFCQALQRSLSFPAVILRPCLIYGPRQDRHFFIPSLIDHCLRGAPEFAMTSGTQSREFAFVEDVVDAFVRAALSPESQGEIINVGSGEEYRVLDVARRVVDLTGSRITLKVGGLPDRPAEIPRLMMSSEKARTRLGWQPRVDLDRGLRLTIEWFRNAASSPLKAGSSPA